MITSVFTSTGPYAILIMLGIKRVENRSVMPVPSKGRCAISCSKKFSAAEYGNFVQWASQKLSADEFALIPSWAEVKDWPGKVIGCVDYAARQEFVPSDLARQVSAADALSSCVGEKVATPADAVRLFGAAAPLAGGNEGLFVLPLDANRQVLSEPVLVSLGDPSTTTVQPGEVFAVAFKSGASAFILAHNHPSGNLKPSMQDCELTASLAALGDQLGIKLLDHFILGRGGEYASIDSIQM